MAQSTTRRSIINDSDLQAMLYDRRNWTETWTESVSCCSRYFTYSNYRCFAISVITSYSTTLYKSSFMYKQDLLLEQTPRHQVSPCVSPHLSSTYLAFISLATGRPRSETPAAQSDFSFLFLHLHSRFHLSSSQPLFWIFRCIWRARFFSFFLIHLFDSPLWKATWHSGSMWDFDRGELFGASVPPPRFGSSIPFF